MRYQRHVEKLQAEHARELVKALERVVHEATADELVAKARQSSARVRFIEDPVPLAGVGGVAAALRYRVDAPSVRKGSAVL